MAGRSAAGGEVQSMIDDLAGRLGRSVVIDDPCIRLVCASRHFGDEDPARVRAVLQRTAGAEIIAFVLAQEPHRWSRAGMLPASPELGLLPRFCVPLREQGQLLGYLMVIDAERTLTVDEVESIQRCARAVAARLHTDQVGDDAAALADTVLPDLLGDDATARDTARAALVRARLLRDAPVALVSVVVVDQGVDTPAQVETALRATVRPLTGSAASCGTVHGDLATLLQLQSHPPVPGELRAQADRMLETARSLLDASARPVVGVGGPASGLGDAWMSRRQAGLAARAARRSGTGGVGMWDRLGELAVLAQLPDDLLVGPAVSGPLAALAAHDHGARLRDTLRCYLDHGGSVPRTAAALHLHRTSLHYRLAQIRTLTGLDLDDGRTRFLLQLGLHLQDLGFPT